MALRHLDLFSGIGGFALAARMAGGIETRQFVEIDPYCRRVLSKNFAGVPIHDDITTYSASLGDFDLVTGGFPCQDISCSNPHGRGLEGKRSGLFFELMRIVRECRPRYVVLENVPEMLRRQRGRVMGTVLWELSQVGFTAEWQTVSAVSMGAPHLRERVFLIAYSERGGHDGWRTGETGVHGAAPDSTTERSSGATQTQGLREVNADPYGPRCEELDAPSIAAIEGFDTGAPTPGGSHWAIEPGILRVANGIPNRLDRIRGLGNAIVPQCGALVLQRVLEIEASREV